MKDKELLQSIMEYIEENITSNLEDMREARLAAGTNCPGFNQALGAHDALLYLKEYIEEQK